MKSLRLLLLPLLAIAFAAPLAAQPKISGVIKAMEPSSVAYINSGAFLDPATGIKQLVKATQGLELEFSSTQSDLSLRGEKLRTLVGELQKLGADPVTNAKAIADKQAQGQQMQQDLQARQQVAQDTFNKRAQEVQGPVTAEIAKELRAFALARDIGLVFDATKMGDVMLAAKPELDITAEFIGYYNSKHP
jgi:Skp family chaperone for outer membrane proteins